MNLKHMLRCVCLAACTSVTGFSEPAGEIPPSKDPQAVYERWNEFCKTAFSALNEPLFHATFGTELKLRDDGSWTHASRNSAAIVFETTLPASSRVEYGPTPDLGQTTSAAERPFFLHLHRLTGLEPGTTYHYRIHAVDERGERLAGEVLTVTTRKADEGISLPAAGARFPIVLDQPGVYVLTQDIVADGSAIRILSKDVTLDLNGFTITYNALPMEKKLPSSKPQDWWTLAPYGVQVDGPRGQRANVRILNGSILQGAGGDGGSANQYGCAPVGLTSGVGGELAGLSLTWHGNQVGGVHVQYGSADMTMHHNVLRDRGTELVNRHQAVRALSRGGRMHHNLIARARQRGIEAFEGGEVYRNEIYVDSWTTNSFAISPASRGRIFGNRIFGSGYLSVGIGTFGKTEDVQVHDNFILMQATKPEKRWAEYGEQSGAHGLRVQWGARNTRIFDNVVIGRASGGGRSRAVWAGPAAGVVGVEFRNNTIVSVAEGADSVDVAAISITGENSSVGKHSPMFFRGNTVRANRCPVRGGETYGGGSSGVRFIGNTFARIGPERDDYRTVQLGFWNREISDYWFIDSRFEGGAGFDTVAFEGDDDAVRNFSVGRTLSLETPPGAAVAVADAAGQGVFEGVADAQGRLEMVLLEYRQSPEGRVALTPHTLDVTAGGRTARETVAADGPRRLVVTP